MSSPAELASAPSSLRRVERSGARRRRGARGGRRPPSPLRRLVAAERQFDAGEHALTAAVREIGQETGLHVVVGRRSVRTRYPVPEDCQARRLLGDAGGRWRLRTQPRGRRAALAARRRGRGPLLEHRADRLVLADLARTDVPLMPKPYPRQRRARPGTARDRPDDLSPSTTGDGARRSSMRGCCRPSTAGVLRAPRALRADGHRSPRTWGCRSSPCPRSVSAGVLRRSRGRHVSRRTAVRPDRPPRRDLVRPGRGDPVGARDPRREGRGAGRPRRERELLGAGRPGRGAGGGLLQGFDPDPAAPSRPRWSRCRRPARRTRRAWRCGCRRRR